MEVAAAAARAVAAALSIRRCTRRKCVGRSWKLAPVDTATNVSSLMGTKNFALFNGTRSTRRRCAKILFNMAAALTEIGLFVVLMFVSVLICVSCFSIMFPFFFLFFFVVH